MILPTRYVVAAEIGTSTRVKRVSRQLNASAPPRQDAIRSGSRIILLMSVLRPCPKESMSLVNRAISSEEPWSEKLARSRLTVLRKKVLRMRNSVNCITSATSTSWRKRNTPLNATLSITIPIEQDQALEAVLGEIAIDGRLDD